MSLRDWAKFGWLKPHETDVRELSKELREDVVSRLRKRYPTLGVPIEDPPGA